MTTQSSSPALALCDFCGGSRTEPGDDGIPCLNCQGSGYAPVAGDLGPSRTHPKGRPFVYYPGVGKLRVSRGKCGKDYTLVEFTPDIVPGDLPARAFECRNSDSTIYHILVNRGWMSCDCAGQTYAGSHKANQRAALRGDAVTETHGCIHTDAVNLLLTLGLLDVPPDVAVDWVESDYDPFAPDLGGEG